MRPQQSVAICPKCEGISSVDDTRRRETWYVKRIRSCDVCGFRWTTAELLLTDVKKLQALERFLKQIA